MTKQTDTTKKRKGILRWEAILPFVILCALIGIYFHFFFDAHLRRALEWGGYKALGAEVNIAQLETSFFKASLRLQGIEFTDSEKPTHNALEVGDIRFSALWDALLRAKFVVNEAVVEKIEFATLRKSPGRVAPPPSPVEGPGMAEKLKDKALGTIEENYNQNILGDIAALLGGSDATAQLNKLQETLPSKNMISQLEKDFQSKKKSWDERVKTLPQGPEIDALATRLNKIKYKDFKSPQELQTSLKEFDSILKEADSKYKTLQSAATDLDKDLKNIESQYRNIEKQIQLDIKSLEQHFRLPHLDAASISRSIFMHYLRPYLNKALRYRDLVEKYMPPNLLNKGPEDPSIQPHPREEGISYEFGRPNSYPLVWIKRAAISSQAGSSPQAGNIRGEVTDITSNQILTGKPTVARLSGDFPASHVEGFLLNLSLDNRKTESEVSYLIRVLSYPLSGTTLLQSPDANISFKQAQAGLDITGSLRALKHFVVNLENRFNNVEYEISAKDPRLADLLQKTFQSLPVITLTAKGDGTLPALPLSINSNLGPELGKSLERQVRQKIEEAQKEIAAYVNEQIGQQKATLEKQIQRTRQQFENEIKKAEEQLNNQKKQADARINQAQKDLENQGRQQLQKEAQKAAEELKKKLGL